MYSFQGMLVRRFLYGLLLGSSFLLLPSSVLSAQVDPRLFAQLSWRNIGPFRGGRTKAAAGVPGQPNVFYIGAVNGGVWKTTDFGRTWKPIFDAQPSGSIGAIAIAPSNPDIVYVGSGEGLQRPDLSTGDGIYKSTDAGMTWTHLGLRDGQQIPQIVVDPKNPDRLFVAVLGHPYGPNPQRGIYRSSDGGRSFDKVLGKDENTGGVDVVLDPKNSDVVYAVLWEARQAPWENGAFSGPGSGLFKSTDGGSTWQPLTQGLPTFAQERPQSALRHRRHPRRRLPLPLRRRRGQLAPDHRGPARRRPSRRLCRGQGRPDQPRHRLHRERGDLEVRRRRQDLHRHPRRTRR